MARRGRPRWRIERAREVIGRVADEAACERRQAVAPARPRRASERLAHRVEQRRAVGGPWPALAVDVKSVAVEAKFGAVAEADVRIARDSQALLHALQQEARTERPQLQESRDRRVEIGGDVVAQVHVHPNAKNPPPVYPEVGSGVYG